MSTDLVFLHSAHLPRCAAIVDKHFTGYFAVQLMTRGSVQLSYDQQVHRLRGRWMWSCWPGPRIRFQRLGGEPYWVHRYVAFTGSLVGRWQEKGLLPFGPQAFPSAGVVGQFDRLLELVRRDDVWGRLRAINLLETILLELAEKRPERGNPWLEQAREKIARQATLWPDYAAVAAELGMGLSTLRRRYRRESGASLHAETMSRRIAAARDLLAETTIPLKDIAARLGYRDAYFFSRQFRRFAGVSPAAYRHSRQD